MERKNLSTVNMKTSDLLLPKTFMPSTLYTVYQFMSPSQTNDQSPIQVYAHYINKPNHPIPISKNLQPQI